MRNIALWDDSVRHPRSLVVQGVVRYRMRTRRLGPTPDFLIIGAQRGGTTFLYHMLMQHPNVYPCVVKEPHYFDQHFARGHDWYLAHFAPGLRPAHTRRVRRFITGEATPCYLYRPHVPQRVHDLAPEAKFIVLLRDPVARAFSHYGLTREWGIEQLSFEAAIEREMQHIDVGTAAAPEDRPQTPDGPVRSYLSRGLYADQLQRWMEVFPREQFLIIQSEAMYRDTRAVVPAVTEFLQLPTWRPGEPEKQRQPGQRRMNDATRARLQTFFRPHNARLFELLGSTYDWDN
jgi:hypothetical protein